MALGTTVVGKVVRSIAILNIMDPATPGFILNTWIQTNAATVLAAVGLSVVDASVDTITTLDTRVNGSVTTYTVELGINVISPTT